MDTSTPGYVNAPIRRNRIPVSPPQVSVLRAARNEKSKKRKRDQVVPSPVRCAILRHHSQDVSAEPPLKRKKRHARAPILPPPAKGTHVVVEPHHRSDTSNFRQLADDAISRLLDMLGYFDVSKLIHCGDTGFTSRLYRSCQSLYLPHDAINTHTLRLMLMNMTRLRHLTSRGNHRLLVDFLNRANFYTIMPPISDEDDPPPMTYYPQLRELKLPLMFMSARWNMSGYTNLTSITIHAFNVNLKPGTFKLPPCLRILNIALMVGLANFIRCIDGQCQLLEDLSLTLGSSFIPMFHPRIDSQDLIDNPRILPNVTKFSLACSSEPEQHAVDLIAATFPALTNMSFHQRIDMEAHKHAPSITILRWSMHCQLDFSRLLNVTTFAMPASVRATYPPRTTHLTCYSASMVTSALLPNPGAEMNLPPELVRLDVYPMLPPTDAPGIFSTWMSWYNTWSTHALMHRVPPSCTHILHHDEPGHNVSAGSRCKEARRMHNFMCGGGGSDEWECLCSTYTVEEEAVTTCPTGGAALLASCRHWEAWSRPVVEWDSTVQWLYMQPSQLAELYASLGDLAYTPDLSKLRRRMALNIDSVLEHLADEATGDMPILTSVQSRYTCYWLIVLCELAKHLADESGALGTANDHVSKILFQQRFAAMWEHCAQEHLRHAVIALVVLVHSAMEQRVLEKMDGEEEILPFNYIQLASQLEDACPEMRVSHSTIDALSLPQAVKCALSRALHTTLRNSTFDRSMAVIDAFLSGAQNELYAVTMLRQLTHLDEEVVTA